MFIKLAAILLLFVKLSHNDDSLLHNLTDAISKLINYYKNNYMYMNLDGIYGLRVIEGQMKSLLKNSYEERKRPKWLTEKLKYLYEIASEVSNNSMKHVKASDPEYFAKLSPFIKEQNIEDKPYKRVNSKMKWSKDILKINGMSESFSDQCMAELLGTGEVGVPCNPTEKCLTVMFEYGHQEYTLLHQILYTMVAEQKGCTKELEQFLQAKGFGGGLDSIQHMFCSNNLFEVVDLLHELPDHEIPKVYQDLFLEQQFVCPAQGFMEFLHEKWLTMILSWQKPTGCFADIQLEGIQQPNKDLDLNKNNDIPDQNYAQYNKQNDYNNHDVVIQSNDEAPKLLYRSINHTRQKRNVEDKKLELENVADWPLPDSQEWVVNGHFRRNLLEERKLQDGCMSHQTAVAAAALSQYLKFMLNPGSSEYQADVHIKGTNYLLYNTWQQVFQMEQQDENVNKLENVGMNDKELVYQNQMNVLQKMDLMDKDNVFKEYDEKYDDNKDAHGYYDQEDDNIKYKKTLNKNVAPKMLQFKQGWKYNPQIDTDDNIEYADYLDEGNKNKANVLNNIIPFNKNQRKISHEKNDDFDPGYGYDDFQKDKIVPEIKDTKDSVQKENLEQSHKYGVPPDNSVSLIKSYVIIMVVMILLLVYMYRFIRKRRIVIRYR